MPPVPNARRFRVRDQALALWLFGIALLGILRFLMRAFRDGASVDGIAWAYLAGGLLVAACGARAWRRHPSPPVR